MRQKLLGHIGVVRIAVFQQPGAKFSGTIEARSIDECSGGIDRRFSLGSPPLSEAVEVLQRQAPAGRTSRDSSRMMR